MKSIDKFIEKYIGKELESGRYYGFSIYGDHIHATTFGKDENGIILYDTGHRIVRDKIDPEDVYSVFSCSIDKEDLQWGIENILYDWDWGSFK